MMRSLIVSLAAAALAWPAVAVAQSEPPRVGRVGLELVPQAVAPLAAPAAPEAALPSSAVDSPRVSNIWIESDLRQALQDISAQTGVAVIADQSVQGVVSLSAREMPLEECLERLAASGAYSFVKVKDYYIFGRNDANSPLFHKVADVRRIKLRHASTEQIKALLPPSLMGYCTYDKDNGVVVITATDALAERIVDAITMVDQPAQQVAVEAIVFELTEDGSKQLGLDWQYSKSNLTLKGENLIGTITYDASSDMATFVDITLRAIVQDERGQVLANPRILAMNGRDAEIFVGQEKYFSLLSGSAFNPYYRLESIKSGVTLKVVPHIGDDGQILLDLEPEVSDVVNDWRRDVDDSAEVNGQSTKLPVVTRRRAKTTVAIRDSQTVIIGGLLREQHRQMVEKVPGLGDLPGLGAAFRKVRDLREQKEIVILITTHLVSSSKSAEELENVAGLVDAYVSPLDAMASQKRAR